MVPVPAIIVREVLNSDVKHKAEIYKVINAAYRGEGGWTTEMHLVNGERATLESVEEILQTNGQRNYLLLAMEQTGDDEESVVGTIQIQPSNEKEAEIGLFSVSPRVQSRGVGGRLLKAALEKMKSLGFAFAELHVINIRTDLLTWYKKLGFEKTEETIPFIWPELLKQSDLYFITLKRPL